MSVKNSHSVLIPPQATGLEKTVLGALLIDSKAFGEVESILVKEVFYLPEHQEVFVAMKSLFESNYPIDLQTVAEKLKSLGKLKDSGVMLLVELTQSVGSTANIKFHAEVLKEKYVKRKVIEVSNRISKLAYNEEVSPNELLELMGQELSSVDDVLNVESSAVTWREAMVSLPEHVQRLSNSNGEITGLPTGLKALDNHFSGWQPQDFIVIGGDSGMGKTAFVMCTMLACAQRGDSVGMFSMEMSVKQLAIRAAAVNSNFHMNQLMRTGFDKDKYFQSLYSVVDEMKEYPIHIDDKPALTVAEMKRKARSLKRKHGIKILVIDFIQMFSGDKELRLNIGEAARECKNLAKELDIPVIALSQISREVRKSKYHLPKKYHLKEASAIEEAADVIGMLYRPSYYGYNPEDYSGLYEELGLYGEENACLLVEKNRNGSLGTVGLRYIEDKTKYVDGVVESNSLV
ncbi:DNA helicase [Tenacibaculum sp. 190524A02b]|uniref:replicative DNA helicase n=1 Tax=Tenacibaculum vairaonense TaxID=3137860 RepID=UPI0032B1706E